MRRVFRLRFARRHLETEIDEELRFHIAMREQSLVESGMSREDAHAAAVRQFGDVTSVRDSMFTLDQERERIMQRANFFDALRQDVVYAVRMLRRNLGFTMIAVVTLALGIGANTAIFALINAVLLQKLNVPHPEQLVAIGNPARVSSVSVGSPRTDLVSYRVYRNLRERTRVFTGVLAAGRAPRLFMTEGGAKREPENPRGRLVSGNYFQVLRVPALIGRTFGPEEDGNVGASPVAVISHDYWTRRFDSDPRVLGKTLTINGAAVSVIGVTPPEFAGEVVGSHPDIWMPLTMQPVIMPNQSFLDDTHMTFLLLLGRLKDGATLQQAQGEVKTLLPLLLRELAPDADFAREAEKIEKKDVQVGDGSRGFSRVRATFFVPLMTLMAGVGLLLLIVCANVANLLLARATARAREMNLRVALGAARSRVVRQLLTESAVLSLLGAAAGLVVGWWGSRFLLTLAADGGGTIPLNIAVGGSVAAFTIGVSLLSVFIFGLAPALTASNVNLSDAMRAHARSVAGGSMSRRGRRSSPTRVVIAAQVALSLLLLVSAGLLVRSMWALQNADIGMDRDHLLIVDIDSRTPGYTGARFAALTDELTARIRRIPGVADVTFSENGIFSGSESSSTVSFEGFTSTTERDSLVRWDEVGANYARAIGARVVEGRDMSPQDRGKGARAILINQTGAKFYFHGASAVGKWMKMDSLSYQIVGVITDAQDHDLRMQPVRRVYFPYLNPIEDGPLRLIVRTSGNPGSIATTVRREIVAQDPALPILGIDPLPSMLRASIRAERLVAKLATGFGVLALILAAIGLYGVMSYTMSQRTGEIGLRVALGAQRSDVIRMIVNDALRLVAVGLVVGFAISLFAMRLLSGQLYGVKVVDPISIGGAVLVLLFSGAIAALVPALRGARVTPVEALREG